MAAKTKREQARRTPTQERARQTVGAVLDAVTRVIERHGVHGITTNRIAAAAGVSIGSLYQYFPDKHAIFAALHARHVDAIDRAIEGALLAHGAGPFEDRVCALVDGLVEAHGKEPALHELLTATQVADDGGLGLGLRLRGAFERALSAPRQGHEAPRDVDRTLLVLPPIIEALAHGAAYRRPARLSLAAAKDEAVRAVRAYLRAPLHA
jgi:AcrR family transcriptional regulator